MRVAMTLAIEVAQQLLEAAGVPERGARQQAELLVDAQAKGAPSHGLLRLPRLLRRIRNGVTDPAATGEHQWESPGRLRVSGRQGLGPVVALRALEAIVPAALENGIAVASLTETNHLGMLAFYTERVARQGLACLAMTSSEPLVHPAGGTEAVVGTNPISIAVPAEPDPLVLDMATAEISMGRVHDYAMTGRALQPGWALDADGAPTVDAAAAIHGSIAPFGGAKGYGLGIGLGALISFVTGSAFDLDVAGTLDDEHRSTKGDLFLVLRGERRSVSADLDRVRASRPADPALPVRIPGDGARSRRARSEIEGVEIADDLWQELLAGRAISTRTNQREVKVT